MSSPFPTIDLTPLFNPNTSPTLHTSLSIALSTTGFAYLTHPPLSLSHSKILSLAHDFFALPDDAKMSVAKRNFKRENRNTYRGYFPAQVGSDNLKEGFEIGRPGRDMEREERVEEDGDRDGGVDLEEGNVWPEGFDAGSKMKLERLHTELQTLAGKLLALLALALGRAEGEFAPWMKNSLSTLRLLHYPAPRRQKNGEELSCTPHTDSGLLTLLFQDSMGGLEILQDDAMGEECWVPAPYVEGSIVVNVGDLMERFSEGKFKATMHRVRSGRGERWSVPFFFEPGRECVIGGEGMKYERYVIGKMKTWVEFREEDEQSGQDIMFEKVKEVSVEA